MNTTIVTKAIAVFPGFGVAHLIAFPDGVLVRVLLHDLSPGMHGFHVHRLGDVMKGCESVCSHYNPRGNVHGDLNEVKGHAGDLGNITADAEGYCQDTFVVQSFYLPEILGRTLVIHADEDDLGRGTGTRKVESLKAGNSGKRLTCGIIGIAEERYTTPPYDIVGC